MNGSFEVIALALEPRWRIDRFCRHYIDQGAARVSLFLDGPEQHQSMDPRIVFRSCDTKFWKTLGMERPFSVEDRQRAVYRFAYDRLECDWCLVVDLDEYIFGRTRLREFFAGLVPTLESVRFLSAEAVFGPEDSIDEAFCATRFRLPMTKYASPVLSRLVYGSDGSLFSRGLLGHSRGKQAIRRNVADLLIDIHDSFVGERRLGSFRQSQSAGLLLGHYDAINYQQWSEKCQRRLTLGNALEMGAKRERQLELFRRCNTEAERRALFRRLYAVNHWQWQLLRGLGLGCGEEIAVTG